MSIPVECGACGAKFAAPETSAGKSGKCPKCGEPITVPAAAKAPKSKPTPRPGKPAAGNSVDAELAPLGNPMADLLDEELAAGEALPSAENPFAADASPLAGPLQPVGKPKRSARRSSGRSSSSGWQARLRQHWLSAAVFAAGLILFVWSALMGYAMGGLFYIFIASFIAGIGFLPRAEALEMLLAKIFGYGLGGLLLVVHLLAMIGVFSDRVPPEQRAFVMGVVLGQLVMGVSIIALIAWLFGRFGFFRTLAWTFISVGLVLPLTLKILLPPSGSTDDVASSTDASDLEPFDLSSAPMPEFRARRSMRSLGSGVQFAEIDLGVDQDAAGYRDTVYLYLPEGEHDRHSLPCVMIAPAGSIMIAGMDLGEADQPEHLPYVKAGFAVVAFELDGPLQGETMLAVRSAYDRFAESGAGLVNGRNALEYVLRQVPEVDPERIYTAGHSSAGTMALLFAAHEPRIFGCVSYAPLADVRDHVRKLTAELPDSLPAVHEFAARSSPILHADRLNCPVMLFHSRADRTTNISESKEMRKAIDRAGGKVVLTTVDRGNHYDSMIDDGIPAGIRWLRSLAEGGDGLLASAEEAEDGEEAPEDAGAVRVVPRTVFDKAPADWSAVPDPAPASTFSFDGKPVSLGAGVVEKIALADAAPGQTAICWESRPSAARDPLSAAFSKCVERFDLREKEATGQIKLSITDSLLDVSPSGGLAAINVHGFDVEVHALDDGKKIGPWKADDEPLTRPRFVDDDHFLVWEQFENALALYELAQGTEVYRLEFDDEVKFALSRGRKYVAVFNDDEAVLVEAMTGEPCGRLEVPADRFGGIQPKWLAFSADGTRLAAITSGLPTQLLVWDLTSGRLAGEADLSKSLHKPGLQWYGPGRLLISDRSDVMLFDVEREIVLWTYVLKNGSLLDCVQGDQPWFTVVGPDKPVGLVSGALPEGDDFRQAISGSVNPANPQPKTARGKPGFGETEVDLAQLFPVTESLPETPEDSMPGRPGFPGDLADRDPAEIHEMFRRDSSVGPGPGALDPRAAKIREMMQRDPRSLIPTMPSHHRPGFNRPGTGAPDDKASQQYGRKAHVDLIVGDGADLLNRLRWFPAAKRPMIGLRWGLGVSWTGISPPTRIASERDLQKYTGTIGPGILDELNQRTDDGRFGDWPGQDDATLRQAVLLGLGSRGDLLDDAVGHGLDMLVAMDIDNKAVGRTSRTNTTMRVRLIDVATKRPLWTSKALSSSQIMAAQRAGNDMAGEFVDEVAQQIESDFHLSPMPALQAEHVRRRVAGLDLDSPSTDEALRLLAELRYYQARQLLSAAEVEPLYEKILGDGKGRVLAGGEEPQRREMLEGWVESQ